jgi:hypothetical protein
MDRIYLGGFRLVAALQETAVLRACLVPTPRGGVKRAR